MFYVGVDPGAVTGVAWYDTATGRFEATFGESMTVCVVVRRLLKRHADGAGVVLAVERFTQGRTVRTQQPDALELIGIMRWFALRYSVQVFLEQGAADAAQIGSRENLVRVGWWTPSDPDQHRNKAAAQVALALLKTDPWRWAKLLDPSPVV